MGLLTHMTLGAIAGMGASTVCHPLDVVKIRMQTSEPVPTSALGCARTIVRTSGLRGMYAGIQAAYLRQWMYGSGRMGFYSYAFSGMDGAATLPTRMIVGAMSGGVASLIGLPSEVTMVRLSAQAESTRRYRGLLHCMRCIVHEEGFAGLFSGYQWTLLRSMLLSSCQMGMSSYARMAFEARFGLGDTAVPLIVGSAAASFAACAFCMPVDTIKNLRQSGRDLTYVKYLYARHGPLFLWRGFGPAVLKLGPYSVLSLTFLDYLNYLVLDARAL